MTDEKHAEYQKRMSNYHDGQFYYPPEYHTDEMFEDKRISIKGRIPQDPLPTMEPKLLTTPGEEELSITWFGHSTVLLQMHGMNLLFDPVFSKRTSPVSFIGPKRFGALAMEPEELPKLDIIILTHDHYDHLDRKTIMKLKDKTKLFVVPLGVENHLLRWGIEEERIRYLAWWEETELDGLTIACTPARHFSSRTGVGGSKTLFASFVLKDEYHQILETGDSGYGKHFEAIHERYGDFDLVLTDGAQFNPMWHTKHMYPEEAVASCKVLGAKVSMPIHWGAYSLSDHAWDEPVERFVRAAEKEGLTYVTPMLGETILLDSVTENSESWWTQIK